MTAKLTLANDGTHPPLNVTERSSAPSGPATHDIYLDDGTNTGGSPAFRRWNGSAWETVGSASTIDSDDVTYTPTTAADWDGGSDPGDVEQALDQLAERVKDIESVAGATTVSRMTGTVVYDSGAIGAAATLDTGTVSFVGYDYLEIHLLDARAQASQANRDVRIAFNNDTTAANYSSYAGSNITSNRNVGVVPGANATADFVGQFRMILQSPAGAKKKQVKSSGYETQSMSTTLIREYAAVWNNTAAITRITLDCNDATNTFAAGSRLLVIGWKAENILVP